jgi:hypothetical protein
MRQVFILSFLISFLCSSPSFSQGKVGNSMMIATGYGGVITNKYTYKNAKGDTKLDDSGFMGGLYLQYVNPEYFQVNGFFYHSPDVNYSQVYGSHLNGDGYFLKGEWGSFVAGLDAEYIRIKMDAGNHAGQLEEFRMNNNVLFLMARTGVKVNLYQTGFLKISAMPYGGVTRETATGNVWVNPPGPAAYTPLAKYKIDDKDWYPSWGINLSANIFYFVDVTFKYLCRAQKDNHMNSFTGQLNVYPTHNFVVSYQYKYMEISKDGTDAYHLLGAGGVF